MSEALHHGAGDPVQGRGLHSFTSQLNLSAFQCDRGCAQGLCSPCEGGVKQCLGCAGCFLVSDTA